MTQQSSAQSPHSLGQPGQRRAPRLGPDDRIAPYITRRGRFRKVDPTKARKLPGCAAVLGVVAWAALLGEALRRAVKASRGAAGGG